MMTEILFREDAYLTQTEASIIAITPERGIIFDKTMFYATSGGQPGDSGRMRHTDGRLTDIVSTVTGETKDDIIHLIAPEAELPRIGDRVHLELDWERRLNLMRMHTACHLLSVICAFPITGASVSETDSRVDFDMPGLGLSKEEATQKLNELIEADHKVFTRIISAAELEANPGLVKSKNVRPPMGAGQIRLVCIGDNAAIDSQPCGGTHVRSTGEIGPVHIAKIEKKGRENRRFRIRFGEPA